MEMMKNPLLTPNTQKRIYFWFAYKVSDHSLSVLHVAHVFLMAFARSICLVHTCYIMRESGTRSKYTCVREWIFMSMKRNELWQRK
jgi:hypothetical protein